MVDPFLLISVKSDHMGGVMDQWKRSIGYNTGIRMTNVKIQSPNECQIPKHTKTKKLSRKGEREKTRNKKCF